MTTLNKIPEENAQTPTEKQEVVKDEFNELSDKPPQPKREPEGVIERFKKRWNEKVVPKWNKLKETYYRIHLFLAPYVAYGKFTPEQIEFESQWKKRLGHPYIMASICLVYSASSAMRIKSFFHPFFGLLFTYQYLRAGEQLRYGDLYGFKISSYTDVGVLMWSSVALAFNVSNIYSRNIRLARVPVYLWLFCLPSFVYHWNRTQEPPFITLRTAWNQLRERQRQLQQELIQTQDKTAFDNEKLEEPKSAFLRKFKALRNWWRQVIGEEPEPELTLESTPEPTLEPTLDSNLESTFESIDEEDRPLKP
jgi:hypothetical protein